jgi:hypothetical protein
LLMMLYLIMITTVVLIPQRYKLGST